MSAKPGTRSKGYDKKAKNFVEQTLLKLITGLCINFTLTLLTSFSMEIPSLFGHGKHDLHICRYLLT